MGLPGDTSGKEPTCQCRRYRRCEFDLWVGKILWRRKWQPTPIFLPGESHGQRSLLGYSPWGPKSRTRLKWFSMFLLTQGLHTSLFLFIFFSFSLNTILGGTPSLIIQPIERRLSPPKHLWPLFFPPSNTHEYLQVYIYLRIFSVFFSTTEFSL